VLGYNFLRNPALNKNKRRNHGIATSMEVFSGRRFDQVQIDTGSDLLALKELDQKLWVTLS
jgi:hypothetical protein